MPVRCIPKYHVPEKENVNTFRLTLFYMGGGHYGPDDRKQSAVSAGIGLGSPKFMTLFLLVPDRCQASHF